MGLVKIPSEISGAVWTVGHPQPAREVIYYRDPTGKPNYSLTPKSTVDGQPYGPVYASEEKGFGSGDNEVVAAPEPKMDRKIKFYRNPMGLPDTSPVPKKDSMGMDYIVVYEDEDQSDPSIVKVSIEKVQRAGVRTESVARRILLEPIHAPGSIQLDERRERSLTLRAEAFIEKVYAGATGQHVKAGEPLFRFYSPQIVQALVDYRLAVAGGQKQAGARKLLNLGIPEEFIAAIPAKGDIPFSMDWPSPVDGVLMSKTVVAGARAMPGDELYRLADVSTVWVIADVSEADVGRVKIGDPAQVTLRSYPGDIFRGKVAFILPELKAETRTAQIRIELPNPEHKLLHRMYADVEIDAGQSAKVLAIPASAIIDSGSRQVAIVQVGEGQFKPTEVRVGRRGSEYVEILEGLKEGEQVVTRANFLIDAESNLQAALTGLSAPEGAAP
ncbi:efflux RND transporter periplasmic adaptor subunit [Aestuariivirga sp.]|uniref:efflux RND transporter periplasmic adaptor subunit n=1 Tax=Aestuariivirga sp. TaxID=2650926 RepID=UPI00359390BB